MRVNDPADHAMHIDEQARFDLAAACIDDGHTWEAMRDAIQRAVDFWPALAGVNNIFHAHLTVYDLI